MSLKVRIIVSVAALVTAFAVGRYTVPVKLKIETKIVEVEKKTEKVDEKKNKDVHKEVTRQEVILKDGSRTITTKEITDIKDKGKIDSTSKDSVVKTEEHTKEVVRETSPTTIMIVGQSNLFSGNSGSMDFGISVSKPVLGPICIGIQAFKSGTVGAGIGLNL